MTAILDKVAAGELLGRRQDMASNQLLSHALEQLLARGKRLRDTEAATMNMQLVDVARRPRPRTRRSWPAAATRCAPGASRTEEDACDDRIVVSSLRSGARRRSSIGLRAARRSTTRR